MTNLAANMTPEDVEAWKNECFEVAKKHLAEKGVLPVQHFETDGKFIAPLCLVSKVKASNGKTYWAISGRLPTDFVEVTAALNAREALRYFSFQWQLKADALTSQNPNDKTCREFANYLVNRAQGVYELYEQDGLWK